MNKQAFIDCFGHIADAPGGIDKLRGLILDLAVRGRLTSHDPADRTACDLIDRLRADRGVPVELGANGLDGEPESIFMPFSLPQGWAWARLGEICCIQPKVEGQDAEASMFLPMEKIGIAWALDPAPEPRSWGEIKSGFSKFEVGDVLLAKITPSFQNGKSGVVPDQLSGYGAGTTELYVLRAMEIGVLPRFVLALVKSPTFLARGAVQMTGTAGQQRVPRSFVANYVVGLPPVSEQREIVNVIDELMALCDELEAQQAARAPARAALTSATLHRLSRADPASVLREALAAFAANIDIHLAPGDGDLAALKQLRQAILDLAVRGRLTHQDSSEESAAELLKRISAERDRMVKAEEIRKPRAQAGVGAGKQDFASPAGWVWASLGQLVLSSDSGWSPACVPSRRTDDSQWGVLKVSAVSWGDFRADEHKLLTPGLAPRPQIEVQDGDFLMSRANTSELVGRSVVVTDPPPRLMLSDKHVRLRFLDRITAAYVNLVNGSSRARGYYASVGTGTSDSMRNITREQILALPIPVPPIAEQKRIVSVVNVLRSHCDELEQQLLDAQSRRRGLGESVAAHVVAVG